MAQLLITFSDSHSILKHPLIKLCNKNAVSRSVFVFYGKWVKFLQPFATNKEDGVGWVALGDVVGLGVFDDVVHVSVCGGDEQHP